MITGALILIFTGIVTFFTGLLPNMDALPTAFTNAWDWFSGFIANMVWTIPHGEDFLYILNTFAIILGGVFIWKLINWVLNKLRGSGN